MRQSHQARLKKEDFIRLKAFLAPHTALINQLQVVFLWLNNPGKIIFVNLVGLVHFLLSVAAACTLPGLVCYGLGICVLLVSRHHVFLPYIRNELMPRADVVVPYTLDDIVQTAVSVQHFFLNLHCELLKVREVDPETWATQVFVALFIMGSALNLVSGFTIIYIISMCLLFLPGIYTYDLFGKLWRHPRLQQIIQFVNSRLFSFTFQAPLSASLTSSVMPEGEPS